MSAFQALLLIAAIGWLWYSNLQARERASILAKRACHQQGLQFLDETVALAAIQLRRAIDGRIGLRRTYHFEFTLSGDSRYRGEICLQGRRLLHIHLPDTDPE